jgi:hypothetical protein
MSVNEKSVMAGPQDASSQGNNCARCGTSFSCGMQAGEASCWCSVLPPVLPLPSDGSGCYCPDCLNSMIAETGPHGPAT